MVFKNRKTHRKGGKRTSKIKIGGREWNCNCEHSKEGVALTGKLTAQPAKPRSVADVAVAAKKAAAEREAAASKIQAVTRRKHQGTKKYTPPLFIPAPPKKPAPAPLSLKEVAAAKGATVKIKRVARQPGREARAAAKKGGRSKKRNRQSRNKKKSRRIIF